MKPFFVNISKRLIKSPKLYIRDSGILHSLAAIASQEQLFGSVLLGASFEGYVIEQIIQLLPPRWQPFYYRTHTGAEVDLVLLSPAQKIFCIKIKYSLKPALSKGFYQSLTDLKPVESFVILPEGLTYRLSEHILVSSLTHFLDSALGELIFGRLWEM